MEDDQRVGWGSAAWSALTVHPESERCFFLLLLLLVATNLDHKLMNHILGSHVTHICKTT